MKKIRMVRMALIAIFMCVNFVACGSDDENVLADGFPTKTNNNVIYYTTTNEIIIRLNKEDVFGGAKIISNEYSTTEGYGMIEFSSEVTAIEFEAFNCYNLKSIKLPNSVVTIESRAFYNCRNLESIMIPKNVRKIHSNSFEGCTNLASIKVDYQNTTYDSRKDCHAIIEKSTGKLILGCKNTIIPNDISIIGSSAFEGCLGLNSLFIPNNITEIQYEAFANCLNLKEIELSSNLKKIAGRAFDSCENLALIIFNNKVAPEFSNDAFIYISSEGKLYYPKGSDYAKLLKCWPFSNWESIEF